ncbi:MAG: signal peptidase II [Rhodobacteraceae bacterium]|nr:signal peptidase II [Paracoccaceae bacterium]
MRLTLIFAAIAFAVDQISKVWIVHGLDLKNRLAMDVLPPFVNFRMGWNEGINFGLFSDAPGAARWVLIVLALAICAWVLRWVAREPMRPIAQAGAGLLIGGALGNVLDRLIYGAVADFLNMSCCGIQNPFTFNLADVAIFAGAILLVVFTGKEQSA